jgi:hypothetical protein
VPPTGAWWTSGSHCLLSASTSLTSITAIGPHHAAAPTYVGEAPKRASGSTWFSKVLQLEIGLSSCVLVAISPRSGKQVWGRAPRGAPGRHPSADTRRWRPGGGHVAGARLADLAQSRLVLKTKQDYANLWSTVIFDNSKPFLLKRTLADVLGGVLVWQSLDRCS